MMHPPVPVPAALLKLVYRLVNATCLLAGLMALASIPHAPAGNAMTMILAPIVTLAWLTVAARVLLRLALRRIVAM